MSAFTSRIARSWSGVSTKGKACSNSACQGVSGEKAWPGRREAALVEHDELLGDLTDRCPDTAALALPLAAVQPVQRRVLAPGVRRERVDLVGRDVEPVAAAVLEQQVVRVPPRRSSRVTIPP